MAVYENRYRPWKGVSQGGWAKIATIFIENFKLALRNRWAFVTVIISIVLTSGFLLVFMISAGRGADIIKQVRPEWFGNNVYRVYLNHDFWGFFPVMVAALVGSGIFAGDLQHNAHLMYLSRPLRKSEYVLGKFLTLVAYLSGCTVAPTVLLLGANILFGIEDLTWGRYARDLVAILGHCAVIVIPFSLVMMALSSVSRRTYAGGVAWVVLYFVSHLSGEGLSSLSGDRIYQLVSIDACIEHVGWSVYELRSPPRMPSFPYGVELSLAVLGLICLVSIATIAVRIRRLEEV